ncbi:MAG: NTP transferase domain-containing protein [Ghiorsea sp.]|nr:NTP transferase domain-containing protein [Ghiorsea sp.]
MDAHRRKRQYIAMFGIQRAIILAAGKGTRLKTFTQHKPKALMLIAGEPAIARVIRHLVSHGIHDIAINVHHHARQIQEYIGHGEKFNANIYYSYEEQLLDSGGGARTALDALPPGETVLIHNTDIMAHTNIQELEQACPAQGCALALVPNPKHNAQGDFSLQNGLISTAQPTPYTFSGISVWHDEALLAYPSQTKFSLLEPMREQIEKQHCTGMVHHGHWFDIGRPRDLIQAHFYYSQEAL